MLLTSVPKFFKDRRNKAMKSNPEAAFIFPANPETLRNPDVTYPFRQESNLFYLTGFEEPESVLMLCPMKGGSYKSVMFVRQRDPDRELWDGERYGVEGAKKIFGFDEVFPIEDFEKRMPDFLMSAQKVFYRVGMNEDMDRTILKGLDTARKSMGRSGRGLLPILDPNEVLGELRLFKSAEEVEFQRKACQITALAHKQIIREVKPGMNESEVEAMIDYYFRKNGCKRLGYDSIVAGGKNACCLHYRSNNDELRDGELLLIDAGGEYNYYTADITRTFPIGKTFTKPQATIYDLVLKAQMEVIKSVRPGARLGDLHMKACEILTEGLVGLGLLKGKVPDLLKTDAFKRFYPHGTGHWLGMDVHDVGLYRNPAGESRPLQAGMIFTVEPGLYFQSYDKEVPEEYRNIGIRIEDDVLVTDTGCEVLTKDVPKLREEIEALKK
jgi:Xaa-Pro aminopeptidase